MHEGNHALIRCLSTTVLVFPCQRIQYRAGDGGAVPENKAVHSVQNDRACDLLPLRITFDFHGEPRS